MYPTVKQSGAGCEGNSFGWYLENPQIDIPQQTDWGLSVIICNIPVGKHGMTNDLKREAAQEWLTRYSDEKLADFAKSSKRWPHETHLKAHDLLKSPLAIGS